MSRCTRNDRVVHLWVTRRSCHELQPRLVVNHQVQFTVWPLCCEVAGCGITILHKAPGQIATLDPIFVFFAALPPMADVLLFSYFFICCFCNKLMKYTLHACLIFVYLSCAGEDLVLSTTPAPVHRHRSTLVHPSNLTDSRAGS